MAKPERRSILTKAPRAEGEAAIGVRTGLQRLQAVPDGEQPLAEDPGLAAALPPLPEPAPTAALVDVRVTAPPKPVPHEPAAPPATSRSRGSGNSAWDGFALPQLRPPTIQFDRDGLLDGPASITTMHLPPAVALSLRQVKFDLDRRGYSVTQSTLVAHALAYAYTHVHSWLEITPADGRRKDADTNLSVQGRRTSFGLTQGIRDASDALLWYAASSMGERAPAKITLQATALAWGLSRMSEWMDDALARPVVVRSTPKHPK